MSTEQDLLNKCPSAYRLFKPNFEIRLDKKRGYASASWCVKAEELTDALKTIAGTIESVGIPAMGATINRIVPLRLPEYPWMIAESVTAQGIGHNGKDGGSGYYRFFALNVQFATPDYDLEGGDAFLTISTRPSGRGIQAPPGALVASGGGSVYDSTLFVPGYTYSVTMHKLPFFDNAFYQSIGRSVNDATWRGAPEGTVLFNGPNANRSSVMGGTTTYDVTLDFEVSAIPWNKTVLSNGTIAPYTLSGGSEWFPALDFASLFPIANIL